MDEQDKTLLQTIQARLEWNEQGGVDWFADEGGSWKIVTSPIPRNPVVTYFKSNRIFGIDPYGQIKTDPTEDADFEVLPQNKIEQ